MAFDYSEFAALSEELVAEFGRVVTFVELGDTPASPSQPWKGAASPRGTPVQTLDLSAVFVEPSSLDSLGDNELAQDFLKRSTSVALVYSSVELSSFDEILDNSDGSRWKITGLSKLKPGDTLLLYYVGLSR